MLAAEADHGGDAVVEQVIAGLKNGPLAHLPSGNLEANMAWLVLAVQPNSGAVVQRPARTLDALVAR